MRENAYQAHLIKRLKRQFRGCIVMKLDSSYLQGIPDLIILFDDRWAVLEVKRSANADIQPNQAYYVRLMDEMSFAAFVCPENEQEVFDALQLALQPRSRRRSRLS